MITDNEEMKKLVDDVTVEEVEYLDRYFPKGDKRRGDALVIYAYMKSKQVKLIKQLKNK